MQGSAYWERKEKLKHDLAMAMGGEELGMQSALK